MKYFATFVTATGDDDELNVVSLVQIDDALMADVVEAKSLFEETRAKAQNRQRSLACIIFHTANVEWAIFDDQSGEIFTELENSELGVVELTEDRYNEMHAAACVPTEDGEENALRTENDFISFEGAGLVFSCERKHSYAVFEAHQIPWSALGLT